MPNVVIAVSVKQPIANLIGWQSEGAWASSGGVVETMGIGVTGKEREPVRGALVDRDLQRIVSGECRVRKLNYIVKVREFAEVGRGCSFIRCDRIIDGTIQRSRAQRAALVERRRVGRAGDAKGRWAKSVEGSSCYRIVPTRAERRLVNIGF